MSVRAVLARPRGNDFEGVYLHNGGEPTELGPVLWNLISVRYGFDASLFSREMIDQNLAGWSNIYVLGGELAKTWDGRTKCKKHNYENFDAMPTMPDYAAIKDDKEFKKLFK